MFKVKYSKDLNKGWSSDKKYIITTQSNIKALMRVSPLSKRNKLLKIDELMTYLYKNNISICQPLGIEETDNEINSYFEWIEGEDLRDTIQSFEENIQYKLGIEAGKILSFIHNSPVETPKIDWEAAILQKIDKKIEMYKSCELKYELDSFFLNSITNYKNLLKNRPVTVQHGDYHIGNMMISEGKLVVIDFDRLDFGDPWEEFNRIVWSAQASPYFASGIVDGYFEHNVPLDFWKLLVLYVSTNSLSSLPWAIPFGKLEIDTIVNQANEVISWYPNSDNPIPTWYIKGNFR